MITKHGYVELSVTNCTYKCIQHIKPSDSENVTFGWQLKMLRVSQIAISIQWQWSFDITLHCFRLTFHNSMKCHRKVVPGVLI